MARPVRMQQGNKKPETEFRRAVMRWLRLIYGHHFFALPIVGGPFQPAGSPDVVCSIRGLAVFIEFKAPGGRVGPRQQQMIDAINAAGGRAGVVATWDELEELLQGIEPLQQGMKLGAQGGG
jgi:hypothetical protein